jgi:hypothetical protein
MGFAHKELETELTIEPLKERKNVRIELEMNTNNTNSLLIFILLFIFVFNYMINITDFA